MKKVKTIVLDITLALGLLVASGFAAGIWPVKGEGTDIFGGQSSGCSYAYLGVSSCSGRGSGCSLTYCFASGSSRVFVSTYPIPCGSYSCGALVDFNSCLSGT
jgi:hypothetical protein